MIDYPYTPYIITEVFLLIFGVTILLRINNNLVSQKEAKEFRLMIYSYLVFLLSDIFTMVLEDGLISGTPQWFDALINGICVVSIPFSAYFWLRFVFTRLNPKLAETKWLTIIFLIPLVFIAVSDFVSIFNGWLFYVDASNHYQSQPYFDYIQGGVNYFYALVPTIYAIIVAVKSRSRLQKIECLTYTIYMVIIIVATLLEGVFPHAPLLALANFLIIEIIFLMIQNMQIYNDALTNLNNRRHLNQYLESLLPKASEAHPVHLLLVDLNGLKRINDHYGHVEGDKALKTVAKALNNVAVQYHGFAARYGGDEFCLVGDDAFIAPKTLALALEAELKKIQADVKEGPDSYLVTVSIGYATAISPSHNTEAFIAQADEQLYLYKGEWYQEHHVY